MLLAILDGARDRQTRYQQLLIKKRTRLQNPSPLHLAWFGSINFWVWIVGSVLGLAIMPVTAILTRHDPLKVFVRIPGDCMHLLTTCW